MKRWRPAGIDDSYITLDRPARIIVVPGSDIRPHSLEEDACDCGMRIELSNGNQLHIKPLFIHNRHSDNDRVEASMKAIGMQA